MLYTELFFLSDIAIKGHYGYVVDYNLLNIYIVDLKTGTYATLIPDIPQLPDLGIDGIDVLGHKAYITAVNGDSTINRVYTRSISIAPKRTALKALYNRIKNRD